MGWPRKVWKKIPEKIRAIAVSGLPVGFLQGWYAYTNYRFSFSEKHSKGFDPWGSTGFPADPLVNGSGLLPLDDLVEGEAEYASHHYHPGDTEGGRVFRARHVECRAAERMPDQSEDQPECRTRSQTNHNPLAHVRIAFRLPLLSDAP